MARSPRATVKTPPQYAGASTTDPFRAWNLVSSKVDIGGELVVWVKAAADDYIYMTRGNRPHLLIICTTYPRVDRLLGPTDPISNDRVIVTLQ